MKTVELPTVEIEPTIEQLEEKTAPQSSSGFLDRKREHLPLMYSGFLD